MKQQVKLSSYSIIITVISLIILISVMILNLKRGHMVSVYILAGAIVAISGLSLFYTPLSVSVDDSRLCINRSLRIKSIPLADIKSIQLCPPTMSERRICGSGGWYGYWGWFKERDLGKYFAYYGKASDCFFIRLKDGRQYMIGCQNPQSIVDFVSKRIG